MTILFIQQAPSECLLSVWYILHPHSQSWRHTRSKVSVTELAVRQGRKEMSDGSTLLRGRRRGAMGGQRSRCSSCPRSPGLGAAESKHALQPEAIAQPAADWSGDQGSNTGWANCATDWQLIHFSKFDCSRLCPFTSVLSLLSHYNRAVIATETPRSAKPRNIYYLTIRKKLMIPSIKDLALNL